MQVLLNTHNNLVYTRFIWQEFNRPCYYADVMDRKPQQQTLSIRISETLRDFLERSKQVLSSSRGEPVSTSDVAKILLESGQSYQLDTRLEVAELQQSPTESLWAIRKKWESKRALSRAEWIFLGQYIQIACEALSEDPRAPGTQAFIVLLEALIAVRGLRAHQDDLLDSYYMDSFGIPDSVDFPVGQPVSEVLPRVVAHLIKELREGFYIPKPVFTGRNLFVALRDEGLRDPASLSRVLEPHMATLYRLGARGHWIREHRPVRFRQGREYVSEYFPPVQAGGFRLTFSVGSDGDLNMLLHMDAKDVAYPFAPYPQIQEFATMLRHLEPGGVWEGIHFFGIAEPTSVTDRPMRFEFRRRSDGVLFGFSLDEWQTLIGLFARALGSPRLLPILAELALVYGEI